MGVKNIANLIQVKNRTLQVEGEIEDFIRKISKKNKIDHGRTNDYGHRSFVVTFVFDQLNIEMFNKKNIDKIKKLYDEYIELRKKQKPLEAEYDAQIKVAQDMKNNIRNHGGLA